MGSYILTSTVCIIALLILSWNCVKMHNLVRDLARLSVTRNISEKSDRHAFAALRELGRASSSFQPAPPPEEPKTDVEEALQFRGKFGA